MSTGADAFPAHHAAEGEGERGERGVYVVVFTSTPRAGRDEHELRVLDDAAYEEAALSGGLLRYVRGSYDGAGCSVCVWRSREDAVRAAALPMHRIAAQRATEFYETFKVETYGG